MSRKVEKGKSALLLEGDKDARLYKKLSDPSRCRAFGAGNRHTAEKALHLLKNSNEPGVLAIVDADTDHIQGKKSRHPDILVTPTRDLECALLQACLIGGLLVEFDLEPDCLGQCPEETVVQAVVPIAYLRYVAESKKWQVRMSDVDFNVFISPKNLECDKDALCRHFAALTLTAGVSDTDYRKELQILESVGHRPYQVARGHDITAVLAWVIGIKRRKKKCGAKVTADLIESYLRTAYSEAEFRKTGLFSKIAAWEKRNSPYKVLR